MAALDFLIPGLGAIGGGLTGLLSLGERRKEEERNAQRQRLIMLANLFAGRNIANPPTPQPSGGASDVLGGAIAGGVAGLNVAADLAKGSAFSDLVAKLDGGAGAGGGSLPTTSASGGASNQDIMKVLEPLKKYNERDTLEKFMLDRMEDVRTRNPRVSLLDKLGSIA